jgi:hypothetical protein
MEHKKRQTSKGASTNPGLIEIYNDKDPLPVAGARGASRPLKNSLGIKSRVSAACR